MREHSDTWHAMRQIHEALPGPLKICCKFCMETHDEQVPATKLAPAHGGPDESGFAWKLEYEPVCDLHFEGWFDDVPADEILPTFDLPGAGS